MQSITEIAVRMASRIARARGATLDSFSLDGVDIDTDEHGTEVIHVHATIRLIQTDEIPFGDEELDAA